mmetsp:Transcript_29419/g.50097  ORF Transcript_29419/g.50097 Transcript_29419/m.50097 type:complete len:303 (+) Transcript_29419:409-1317(+)
MRSMTINHRAVSFHYFPWMIHDNNLSIKTGYPSGWTIICIRSHISSTYIFDSYILHVETNIRSWANLKETFMMDFARFHFSLDARRGKLNCDTWFYCACFNSSHWNSAYASNFVHILDWNTKCFVYRTFWWCDIIKCFQESGPIVPRHIFRFLGDIVTFPSRNWDKGNFCRFVTNFLQIVGHLIFDIFVALLTIVDCCVIHFVHRNNHLLHTQCVRKQGVLTRLTLSRDTGFEPPLRCIDDHNSHVCLARTRNHILNKIPMSRSINDGIIVFLTLEFPQGDINCDAAFALGLQIVQNPGIFI